MKYQTTSAIVSGALCGSIWWPVGHVCGLPVNLDLRRDGFGRFSDSRGATFRDVLLSMQNRHGGDFQNPQFTADTVIRIERRSVTREPDGYRVHVYERPVADLPDCADLVDPDHESFEFCEEY